jgi:hypothetical protein
MRESEFLFNITITIDGEMPHLDYDVNNPTGSPESGSLKLHFFYILQVALLIQTTTTMMS